MRLSPASLILAPTPSLAAILYATHYTGTLSTLSLTNNTLSILASDRICGRLPSWSTYDPASSVLYCLDETNSGGSLNAFNVSSSGELTPTASVSVLGNAVYSALYGGENGDSFQALAHYQTSQLSTFALPITSSSKALQTFKFSMSARGPNPSRQEAPHPHMTAVDPTGAYIIVPDLGADLLRIYSINNTTGIITSCANVTTPAGSGPRHAAFRVVEGAAGGTMMYLGNELGNTVDVYSVAYPTTEGGCLGLYMIESSIPYREGQAVKQGQGVGEVRVMGSTLTVSNRGDATFGTLNDSIAVFPIDASGAISTPAITPSYGSYPRTMQINKAGDLVAVGDQDSGTVVIVKRDPYSGALWEVVANVTVGPTGTNGSGGLSSVIWME